jgi:ATP-dependent DNA helicase Rep
LGLKPQFSILDASDTTQLIAEMSGSTDKIRAKALQWQIGPQAPVVGPRRVGQHPDQRRYDRQQ